MNKADLIVAITQRAKVTKAQATVAVEQVLTNVIAALRAGEKVTLVGFGTFSVTSRAARMGRNPRDSKPIKIAAKKVAKFKPGKKLVEELNGKAGKKRR